MNQIPQQRPDRPPRRLAISRQRSPVAFDPKEILDTIDIPIVIYRSGLYYRLLQPASGEAFSLVFSTSGGPRVTSVGLLLCEI